MTGTSANPILNQAVTFIQNAIPGFEAGTYRLSVSQTLTDAPTTADPNPPAINTQPIALTYDFAVTGDRFAFAQPDSSVFAVFPPDNGSGGWDNVFPHAVFPLATLPWTRSPAQDEVEPDAKGDVPTWLWVMLLDDGDAAATGIALDPVPGTIGDLFHASVNPASTLAADSASYFEGGDASDLEPGQAFDTPIQYVDVPLALFQQLAPNIDDLRLMAHVRQVSFLDKPTIAAVTDVGQPAGSFSIVFGNRLPADGANTHCYLVSLEGLSAFLPATDGTLPPANGVASLRLAVLRAWRFRSVGQPASFVNTVMALNTGTSDGTHNRTTLTLPYAGGNAGVQSGFAMGYVPLDTVMRTGEQTLGWYRGPLAPYANAAAPPSLPLSSADAGLIFDPVTGMFDASYAAAWTIGRLLALQDQSFSTQLYLWKRSLQQGLLASVSANILAQRLAAFATPALPDHVTARLAVDSPTASFANASHIVLHALAGRE